jgi:hypothetical protein
VVEEFIPQKKNSFLSLLTYIKDNINSDFYVTENNMRYIVKDEISLKKLLKECTRVKIVEEHGDVLGIICLWKSEGNGIKRYYIKLNAINEKIADSLLKVTLWNTKEDLFTKIKKNSKFYKVFRNNRFNFSGSRGNEILLQYSKFTTEKNNANNHK